MPAILAGVQAPAREQQDTRSLIHLEGLPVAQMRREARRPEWAWPRFEMVSKDIADRNVISL
jgi:hypothetical protein